MAMNHQISSNIPDRYHGVVKAKELRSQKQHGHGNMRAELRGEGSKPRPEVQNGLEKSFKHVGNDVRHHQPRDKIREHGRDAIDRRDRSRSFDRYDFEGRGSHHKDVARLSPEHLRHGPIGQSGNFQSTSYQFTQITVTYSSVFSGAHLGSPKESSEAHKNFLDAARSFIEKPNEQNYKSLNDAMLKLMDPKFAPATVGGAASVKIRDVNGMTMARFTMEVTPAPTKSLEEAREDLKNAYSSKRNGEKDISSIREEAYANYIRALSEKYKQNGVISHTNHTPTTPVFKSSVVYVVKVTQISVSGFHEIKKPDFKHNPHGKLSFKNQGSFWNDSRKNSYVEMLKRDSGKSYRDKDFPAGRDIDSKHSHRYSGDSKSEKTSHKHHDKIRPDKAS